MADNNNMQERTVEQLESEILKLGLRNKELQENLARFRAMVEKTPAAIVVEDENRNIIITNQAFCDIFAIPLSPDELVGSNCSNAAEEVKHLLADPDAFPHRIEKLLSDRMPVIAEEIIFADGRIFERDYIPVFDDNEDLIGHMWQYRDITLRKQAEINRHRRDQLLQLLTRLATTFVSTPADMIDKAINKALKEVGTFIGVDRVYLFRHDYDKKITTNTHEWCADGIVPQIDNLQSTPFEYFPEILAKQMKGEVVYIPSVSDLPPGDPMKTVFESQDIKSLILIPTMYGSKCLGFVGFDAVRKPRKFTDIEINLLKILAELLTNAELRRQSEESLLKTRTEMAYHNKLLEALFKNSTDAIVYFDENNRIIDINDNFQSLFGCKLEEIKGMDVDDALNLSKPGSADKSYTDKVLAGDRIIAEGTRYTKAGKPVEVLIKGIPVFIDNKFCGGYAIYSDISARKQYEKQLKYVSLHDQLTGLYNRSYFENELVRLDNSRDYPITIIVADLDGLKLFNDTVGHEQGDRLLIECAEILKKTLRKSDILARIGGDEFVVIMPQTDRESGKRIAGRIQKNIENFNREQSEHLPLSISMGLATAENKGMLLEDTFKEADDLMYRDKLSKGDFVRARIFDSLIASLGKRDYLDEGHTRRLEDLCSKIGEAINLSSDQIADLKLLAQAHDLGKAGIPDQILFKEGPLTEEEWAVMKQHSEKGYRIALSSSEFSGIADFILKHHESWDGSGYPLGIKGEEIPIECRILAIADAFDAMVSDRTYRKALTKKEAIAEIKKKAGSQFDPALVSIFISIVNLTSRDFITM